MGWFSDTFLGTEDAGGKRQDYLTDRKQGEFEQYATDFGSSADKWSDRSDQFFDPNSAINTQRFGIMNEALQDQTTSGIRDWQSTMAMQGMGQGAGGVGAQNVLQARRRAGGDSASAMNRAYQDSFGLGLQSAQFASGQRTKGQGATGQADQIYAGANQAKMQQDSINAQKKAGFNQMLAGAAIGGIMPGVKGMLGGAMQGIGEGSPQWMQNFAKPYQDKMSMQNKLSDHMSGLMKYTQDQWGYDRQGQSGVKRYGAGAAGSGNYSPPQMPTNYAQWAAQMGVGQGGFNMSGIQTPGGPGQSQNIAGQGNTMNITGHYLPDGSVYPYE